MSFKYAYIGSTDVSKKILEQSVLDPCAVISFNESYDGSVSGFATYEEYGDRWHTVDSINSERAQDILQEVDPDVVFVMAWQELLNTDVLGIPTLGFIGRHLSLLPKRRGRAPVAWSLIQGLNETGVTLFWLTDGIDSGDIISQKRVLIEDSDEAGDLLSKMTATTVGMLDELLPQLVSGVIPAVPQNDAEATYTHPRRPDMGLINWKDSASILYDFIRGQTHPYPGAFTYHRMDKVKVWHASVAHRTQIEGLPGEVLLELDSANRFCVQTGEGILEVEVENKIGAYPIGIGSVFGAGH